MSNIIPIHRPGDGRAESNVTEFCILSPKGAVHDDPKVIERLKAHMDRRWPDFTFYICEAEGMRDQDDFVVIPMLGHIGTSPDPDEIKMLAAPPKDLMLQIKAWIGAFDPYKKVAALQ